MSMVKIKIKGPKILMPMAKKTIQTWLRTPQKPLIGNFGQYFVIEDRNGNIIGIVRVVISLPGSLQGYVCVLSKKFYFSITKK